MARASHFPYQEFAKTLGAPLAEVLYDIWLRAGGAPSPAYTLDTVGTAIATATETAEDALAETGNIFSDVVEIDKLRRRIEELEKRIDDAEHFL